MAEEDEATVYGRFEDAMSRPMDEAAESAAHLSHELDETGASGAVAAAGMDRASASAGRLKDKMDAVTRAQEAQRLAALNSMAAEEKVNQIRSKGVLNAQDTARTENILAAARRDSTRAASDLARATEDLDRKTKSLGQRLLATATSVKFLERAFSGLKLVATAEVFASLIAGVSSLGAAAIAAVGGLAPMVGLLGALPALGGGLLSVVATFGLITSGIGSAVKAMFQYGEASQQAMAALNQLGPNARAAAFEIGGYAASFKGLKDAVIGAALPFIGPTLRNVVQLLPTVQTGLQGVAGAIGSTVESLSKDLVGWKPDIELLMQRNTVLVGILGQAAISGIHILKDVAIDAGSLTQGIADHLSGGLDKIASWFDQNPTKVENFFNRALTLTLAVGHALRELGGGLLGLFKGATPLSDSLGSSLLNTFTTFNTWANSTTGQQRIQKFFTDTIPVVDKMGQLIETIVHSLGELSSNNGFARMLGEINILLPVLTKVVGLLSEIPGAGTVFGALFVANKLGASPAVLAKGVSALGSGISKLLSRGGESALASKFGVGGKLLSEATAQPVFVTNWPGGLGGLGGGGAAKTVEKDAEEGAGLGFFTKLAAKAKSLLGVGADSTVGSAVADAAGAAAPAAAVGVAAVGAAVLINQGVTDNSVAQRGLADSGAGLIVALLKQAQAWSLTQIPGWKTTYDNQIKPLVTKAMEFSASSLPGNLGPEAADKFFGEAAGALGKLNKRYHGSITGRFQGGPMMAGQNYMVGERGPELLLTAGSMRVVGGDGAELMRPTQSGFVLPNEALRSMVASIPNPSTRAAAATRPELAMPPGGSYEVGASGGTATIEVPIEGRQRPIVFNIYPQTPMDIDVQVRAAMAAVRREERDRR